MEGHEDISRLEMTVGRYMLFGRVGSGGMGSVHLGRRVGAAGFSRLVAIKRLHPHLSEKKELVHAFLDEARIAARISHPNVVSIDDVVMDGEEVLLVMEYIHGRALSALALAERAEGRPVPAPIAAAIAIDMLHGLQAAHDARDERGDLLGVIHRDVSPQNVLVGVDGVTRVLDFGIAKAMGRLHETMSGSIKGKLPYMAPERLIDEDGVTTSVDLFAAAVVIWEMVAGRRYYVGETEPALIQQVIAATYRPLGNPVLGALDGVLARALSRSPTARHGSCRELGTAIEDVVTPASRTEVAAWVMRVAGVDLDKSADMIAEIEQRSMPYPGPQSQAQEGAPATIKEEGPPAEMTSAHLRAVVADLPVDNGPVAMRNPTLPARSGSRTFLLIAAAALVMVVGVVGFVVGRRGNATPIAAASAPTTSVLTAAAAPPPPVETAIAIAVVPSAAPAVSASASATHVVGRAPLHGKVPPVASAPPPVVTMTAAPTDDPPPTRK